MEQKDTNFIRLENTGSSPKTEDNIFNELWGDLDFGAIQQDVQKHEPVSLIAVWYKMSYILMTILIVMAIIATLDVFLKSSDDNTILSFIPGCEYIATYGSDVPNTDCKTVSMLLSQNKKDLTALEDGIGKNMEVVLPKLLKLANVLTLPEVRFIQENTSNTRVDIVDMLSRFQKIKNDNSITYGSFIDCKVDLADERGNLNVGCTAYGWRLLSSSKVDPTSRNVAAMLIDKLSDPNSGFIVVEMPKVLDISQFMSTDPGKSLFNTQTNFALKLKFTPNSQL